MACSHKMCNKMIDIWYFCLRRQQQCMIVPIESITSEIKYHSFIVCQTQDKEIAQKWDYYILSSQGQLLMSSEEHKSDCQYNISIDTLACNINNKNLVLGMGDWLKKCLMDTQAQLLKKHKVLRYETLWLAKSINFFYYIGVGGAFGERFIQVFPKYIHEYDCLIFQYSTPVVQYKCLNSLESCKIEKCPKDQNIFSFRSEYALLSDMHFLNCLVRCKKETGSYIKDSENGYYQFWINPHIIKVIHNLYPPPKL